MAVTDSKGSTYDIEIKAGRKGAESSLLSCGMHPWCSDCNIFQQDARSCWVSDTTEISYEPRVTLQEEYKKKNPTFSYYKNWPNLRTET